MPGSGLFFDPGPDYPTLWILGLIGFLAFWSYVVGRSSTMCRMWLILWVPGALTAALVYRLGVQGQSVTDTLHLLVQRDPATLRALVKQPDAYSGTYGVVVGGTVAALISTALQFAGVLLGAILSLFTAHPRHKGRRT